jgi:hypothetical protein
MNELLNSLDKALTDVFAKAPALPKSARDVIVKIAPWAALLFGVMGALALLPALGITAMATPWMMLAGRAGLMVWVAWGILAANVVLDLMAVQPLMARKMRGWQLMFYASLLGALTNLLNFSLGGLVGVAIGWYILYGVKKSYK